MIINSANLNALNFGFKTSFQNGFAGVSPQWGRIATLIPSTTREEKYGWLGQWPKIREWVGDRQVQNLAAHDYAIQNKDFESTVSVPRNSIEDDAFGIYTPIFTELGRAAGTHPDELVFALLLAGFGTKCFDGQFMFDTDHPVGAGFASNMQAGSGSPWFLLDTSRALKPLIYQKRKDYKFTPLVKDDDPNVFWKKEYIYGVDARSNVGFGFWQMAFGSKDVLSKDNFVAARAAMSQLKSDEGRPLGVRPTLLVVGPGNEQAANELIKAERNAAGATNTLQNAVDILVSPFIQ